MEIDLFDQYTQCTPLVLNQETLQDDVESPKDFQQSLRISNRVRGVLMESEWMHAGYASEVLETDRKDMCTLCILFPRIEFTRGCRELKLDNKLLVDIVIYKYIYDSSGS